MIFKDIFAKKMAFWLKTKLNYANKKFIIKVFEKNANFFAENCQKSQKIVIITSVSGTDIMKKLWFKEKIRLIINLSEYSYLCTKIITALIIKKIAIFSAENSQNSQNNLSNLENFTQCMQSLIQKQ
jgi:hypothetical protein